MEIKAIETRYRGNKFRSRLEAKWAVFFDTVGIKYIYELEGFKNSRGDKYLPDFYLPEEDMYVEVKPWKDGAGDGIERATRFLGNKMQTLLVLPNIPEDSTSLWHFPVFYRHPVSLKLDYKLVPFAYDSRVDKIIIDRECEDWEELLECHMNLFFFDKYPKERDEILEKLLTPPSLDASGVELFYPDAAQGCVREAFTKARMARFEWGDRA